MKYQSRDNHMINRCTALHYCAAYNFLDFIEDFLELGAVVDVEDNKGNLTNEISPLRYPYSFL